VRTGTGVAAAGFILASAYLAVHNYDTDSVIAAAVAFALCWRD
jgi:hypothetical protein